MLRSTYSRAVAVAIALLTTGSLASANVGFDFFDWDWGHRGRRDAATVYTMSNAADGNRILVFDRKHNGDLKPADSFPTGGFGTGAGLGNQSGLVLSGDWLFAVNAGSAEVSLFEVVDDVLVLRDLVPSGGPTPLSIAVDHRLVYVLNGGGSTGDPDNITGFYLDAAEGRLIAIPDSTRTLSGDAVGPAQVGFSAWGNVLVVTEKMTNTITTFTVDDDGLASTANPQASAGVTPFGFATDHWGRLFVSEAAGGAPGASTVSSYWVGADGVLATVTAALPTTQTAACWVALDKWGRHAYTTNTGSSTITGLDIAKNGTLALLDDDGVTASTGEGSAPIDMALTRDGKFLYALSGGSNTITGYRVRHDGSLELVETQSGLPDGTNGLAAR